MTAPVVGPGAGGLAGAVAPTGVADLERVAPALGLSLALLAAVALTATVGRRLLSRSSRLRARELRRAERLGSWRRSRSLVASALTGVGRATRRDGRDRHGGGRPVDGPVRGAMVVLAVVIAGWVHPIAAAVAAIVLFAPPALHRRRARRRRTEAIVDELPDVVELLHLAVSAGLNLRLALDVVVAHSAGPCTDALAAVTGRVERGQRLVDALGALGALGLPARPLLDALVAAEHHGTPVLEPLARVADDLRTRRRQRRDERARRLPVALLFPLVCCTLPALALVTVVPVVARPWTGSSP